jgi:hypothetical protein
MAYTEAKYSKNVCKEAFISDFCQKVELLTCC